MRLERIKKLKQNGKCWNKVRRRIVRIKLIKWMRYYLRLKWEVRTYQVGKRRNSGGGEMPGVGKGISKEETYRKYGHSARQIEIGAIEKHGTFWRIPYADIP